MAGFLPEDRVRLDDLVRAVKGDADQAEDVLLLVVYDVEQVQLGRGSTVAVTGKLV